jgi:pimeloyl-ACP methyl ester carboxylesterase
LQPVLDGYLDRLSDRYRVLRVDYPSIGGSRDIAPEALTADRVCADLLAVASAAGFDRFAYWGYSWGAAVGLQLAARTDRLTALVLGGWPPLGAPYDGILQATRLKQPDPEPSSLKVLRSKAQYRQWETFYVSLQGWPEAEAWRASVPEDDLLRRRRRPGRGRHPDPHRVDHPRAARGARSVRLGRA